MIPVDLRLRMCRLVRPYRRQKENLKNYLVPVLFNNYTLTKACKFSIFTVPNVILLRVRAGKATCEITQFIDLINKMLKNISYFSKKFCSLKKTSYICTP